MLVYIVKHVQNNAFLAQKPSLVVGFVLTEIFQVRVMPPSIFEIRSSKTVISFSIPFHFSGLKGQVHGSAHAH